MQTSKEIQEMYPQVFFIREASRGFELGGKIKLNNTQAAGLLRVLNPGNWFLTLVSEDQYVLDLNKIDVESMYVPEGTYIEAKNGSLELKGEPLSVPLKIRAIKAMNLSNTKIFPFQVPLSGYTSMAIANLIHIMNEEIVKGVYKSPGGDPVLILQDRMKMTKVRVPEGWYVKKGEEFISLVNVAGTQKIWIGRKGRRNTA